ncbi:MAG: tyrosine-type recombinase/integrase [Phycisphaeraceae bacterium]
MSSTTATRPSGSAPADRNGKRRTAPLTTGRDGSRRIATECAAWIAKYRDGTGKVVKKSTGCRDESAARAVLNEMVRRSELVKANVITAAQDSVADHQDTGIAQHLAAYIEHQRAKGLNAERISSTETRITRVADDCRLVRLRDLNAAALERWLTAHQAEDMSAGNRNEYRQAMVGFANWCVRTHRLVANPFAGVPKADARADQRRKRRALTPDELTTLRAKAHDAGDAIPARLPADEPLLTVPTSLRRSLDGDLQVAGIAKADDRGRTVDVHSLRHTFGTLLSKGGVAPRTAQAAMRHGSIDLTMNTYTDPRLLDVAGALTALPSLDLDNTDGSQRQRATGTTGDSGGDARMVVPMVVPTTGQSGPSKANADNAGGPLTLAGATGRSSLTADTRQNKTPADSSCQRVQQVEAGGGRHGVRCLFAYFPSRGALGSDVTGASPVTWGRVTGVTPRWPCCGTGMSPLARLHVTGAAA